MTNNEVVIGAVYEHYKGQKYKVHGLAVHSETLEELVYYECLYENELGKFWVRPKKMFTENVDINGKSVNRFKQIKN